MPHILALLSVNPTTHEPTVPDGTISAYVCWSLLPATLALFSATVDQTAYDAIEADRDGVDCLFIADLDTFALEASEVVQVTTNAAAGNGSLWFASTLDGVKLVVLRDGDYYDVDSAFTPESHRAIVGSFTSKPAVIRASVNQTGAVVRLGSQTVAKRNIALIDLSVAGGVGSGVPSRRANIQVLNGIGMALLRVTSTLSNDHALSVNAQLQAAKDLIAQGYASLLAWDVVLAQTLYENPVASSNSEGRHPMIVNVQEGGRAIIRRFVMLNGEQRNPRISELSSAYFIDGYVAGHVQLATAKDTGTVMELARVLYRENIRSSSGRATIVIDGGTPSIHEDTERRLKNDDLNNTDPTFSSLSYTDIPTPTFTPSLEFNELEGLLDTAGARVPYAPKLLTALVALAQATNGDSRAATSVQAFFEQSGIGDMGELDERGYPVEV